MKGIRVGLCALVAFAVLAGWFGRRTWQTRNRSRAAVRADPHVHHVVAALAMVFMEGALALHGAAAVVLAPHAPQAAAFADQVHELRDGRLCEYRPDHGLEHAGSLQPGS